MSKRAVLSLAVVVALLLGYVLVFERTSVTSKELSERAGRVLVTFVRDKIDRLEVERKGVRVVLERKPDADGALGSWKLVSPEAADADEDAVDQLLGELEWLSARRVLKDIAREDVARFGLDKPRYRVAYRVGGARHVLLVGRDDVHGDAVYAGIEGAPDAYVVPKSLVETLDREPLHYRDKRLFPALTVGWVRKLTMARAGATSEITKEGDRYWLSDAPRGYADDKKVRDLLHVLAGLRAARHLEPAELAAARTACQATPSLRLDVSVVPDEAREDQSPRAFALAVHGACASHADERYAQVGELIVCLRDADVKALDVPSAELRDRRLFAAAAQDVERIDLVRGERKLALMRDGADWKQGERRVDRQAVERWLDELASARAEGVQAVERFVPHGSLTLWLTEGKREQVATGDLTARGEVLVKRGDEPLTLRFPGTVFDRLTPAEGRFASSEVWGALQPSQVTRIEAQADKRARTWVLEGGSFRAAPSAPAGDAERVRERLRELVNVRMRSFVTDQPRAAHGLDQSSARVRLTLEDGGTRSLAIGAATAQGALARIDDGPVVEVERSVVAIVTELAGGARYVPPAADEHEEHDEEEHDEERHDEHAH